MLPLYANEPIPAGVFWTLYITWYVIEMAAYWRLKTPAEASKKDRGSRAVLIIGLWSAISLGFVFAAVAPSATILFQRQFIFSVGLALFIAGAALRMSAMRALGRFHTMDVATQSGQLVIESGPYRWIRHPSYAGALLTLLGILICSTNWLSLACFGIGAGGYAYRIVVEERALSATLGEPYREYLSRTRRLIPFVL
jgi:protein-S-isoprenylcysteine O-methyltransferase Ste14